MSYWPQNKSIKRLALIISLNINLFLTQEYALTNSDLRVFSPIKRAIPNIFLKINARLDL